MIRFAMTRVDEGASDVPVAISANGEFGVVVRLKKSVGTEPHVMGATKVATAERPGCKNLSNLCTSFGVFPPCEKRGLTTNLRGPHCIIISSLDLIGSGYSELRLMLKLRAARLCSCRSSEKTARGCDGLYVSRSVNGTLRR